MHQSLVKFSESEASNHMASLADFTTTTPELKFSVHTGIVNRPRSPAHWHDAGRRAREGQGVGDGRDDGDEEVREKIRLATMSKLR